MKRPEELGLPHRAPFVFIDEVTELDPGVAATGKVSFAADTAFFAGHFPGQPIVPGVILTEAMAQLAGIVSGSASGDRYLLSAVRDMKFRAAVGPETTIELHAEKAGELAGLHQFDVRARTEEGAVADGRIVLSRTR